MLIENIDKYVQEFSEEASISGELAKRIIDMLNSRAIDVQTFNWVINELKEQIAHNAIADKLNNSTDEEISNAINSIIADMFDDCYSEIKLSESEFSDDKEYELITTAKQTDHRYGDFEYTKDQLETMASNFNENIVGTEIPVDLNHDTDHIAYAWIKPGSMVVKESTKLPGHYSLYGQLYKMTPKGRELITTGAVRYFSLQIQHEFVKFVDKVKKVYKLVIRAMALTNMPVIKDMAPTFSERVKTKSPLFSNHSPMDKTPAELKLAEDLAQRDTQLSEAQNQNKILAEKVALAEKKERDGTLTTHVDGLFLSEDKKVGFKGGEKEKVLAFVLSLSDEKAAEYIALHSNILTTVKLGEEGDGGDAPDAPSTEDKDPNVEAEEKATALAEKEKIDPMTAYNRVLAEDPKLAKRVEDSQGY